MTVIHEVGVERGALSAAVRGIRQRWRVKHALRGGAIAVGLAFVALVAAAYVLQWGNYADSTRLALRLLLVVVAGVLAWRYVVRPLRAALNAASSSVSTTGRSWISGPISPARCVIEPLPPDAY